MQQTIHRITTINLNQSKLDQYLHIKSDKSMKLPQEEWNSGVAATRLIVISAIILIHGIAVFHPDEIWLVALNQKENLSAWIIGAFKTIFSPFWMSILFMLSGALSTKSLARQDKGNYLISRAQRLLLPPLLYILFLGPLTRLIPANSTSPELNLFNSLSSGEISLTALTIRLDSLWFCVTLFIFDVVITQLSESKVFLKFQQFTTQLIRNQQRFFSWTAVTTWIAATTLLSYCLRLFGSSIYAKPINNLLNTIGLTHYSGHLEWVATDFSVLFFSFAVLDLNRKIQLHSTERFFLAIAWTLSLTAITNDTFQGAMINETARCTYIGTSLCISWAMIKSYKQNQFDTFIKTGSECSYGALIIHSLIFSALAGIASFLNIPGHSGIVTVPITGLAMSYGLSFILRRNQYIAKII